MHHSGEVSGAHLDRLESEFRRRLNQLDAEWQRRFDDLDRRLRETKSALEALDRRVSATASEWGDGMMTVMAWAPLWLVILVLAVARR